MVKSMYIQNENNEKILVEVYEPISAKETIVFCHGITGCRKGRTMNDNYFQTLAKQLMEKSYKVVLFDFTGHGESEGNDYDVTLSKSTKDLKNVLENTIEKDETVNFLVFSYGAAVLANYLENENYVKANKIVMYSPCLFPLESCFLNKDSLFGKDIVEAYENGSLFKDGFTVVGAKNFKFSSKMIDECKSLNLKKYEENSRNILCLSGKNDVILNTKFNEEFCKKNNISNIYLNASHALFEEIDNAFEYTIKYLENIAI